MPGSQIESDPPCDVRPLNEAQGSSEPRYLFRWTGWQSKPREFSNVTHTGAWLRKMMVGPNRNLFVLWMSLDEKWNQNGKDARSESKKKNPKDI